MPKLRAVKPGEVAKKLSLIEAAESGNRRALLVSLRARVARSLETPDLHPRDLAALSRQLRELAEEIAVLDAAAAEADPVAVASETPDEPWDGV